MLNSIAKKRIADQKITDHWPEKRTLNQLYRDLNMVFRSFRTTRKLAESESSKDGYYRYFTDKNKIFAKRIIERIRNGEYVK